MFTTDAVLRSGFQHLNQMDWDPQLSGFEGWGSEVSCPTRWCAGLPSWILAFAQPVFGSKRALGDGRLVKVSLIFTEHYPRFSSNPVRSFSPERLEMLGVFTEENGEGDGEHEEERQSILDAELLADYPELKRLLAEADAAMDNLPKRKPNRKKSANRKC